MKRYQEYMEQVEVSRDLHERLTGLSAPRQGVPWKKYGAIAAALVLAVGLGAFGLWDGLGRGTEMSRPGTAENDPDIATLPPGETPDPGWGDQTDGGYELTDGEMVAYYMLPYIQYNPAGTGATDLDRIYPPGSSYRKITHQDVIDMLGGEEALADHLNWAGCQWTDTVHFGGDGKFIYIALWGEREDLLFELQLSPDEIPPDCIADEGEVVSQFHGVDIIGRMGGSYGKTGDDGTVLYTLDEGREVSFLANGLGVRFQAYGPDRDTVEENVARLVRWAVVEGMDLALSQGAVTPIPPIGEQADWVFP